MIRTSATIAFSISLSAGGTVSAQTLSALFASPEPPPSLPLRLPSIAAEQLYTDVLVYGEWRIQRSELTGSFRLLDPENRRRTWGSEQQCREEFTRLRALGFIPALHGRAVLTLHGFGRSRDHMQPLGRFLRDESGVTWINVTYSSTRGSLGDHAQTLARIIDGLEGIDAIDIVGHSLGNLVVRRYLGEATAEQPRWQIDPRLRRMVMLGPPNNGARMATLIADLVSDSDLARLVTGPSAWQLARQWDDTQKRLATPTFDFGVIAGGLGDGRGMNPLLPGDDDFIVRVEETRLTGACDFRRVPCHHGRMMRDPEVQKSVLSFLETGCFTSAEEKQPITTP